MATDAEVSRVFLNLVLALFDAPAELLNTCDFLGGTHACGSSVAAPKTGIRLGRKSFRFGGLFDTRQLLQLGLFGGCASNLSFLHTWLAECLARQDFGAPTKIVKVS